MKRKHLLLACFAALFVLMVIPDTHAQKVDRQTLKWYRKGAWLNGLALKPHASVNKAEFARQYKANQELWDKAFAFLRTHDVADLQPGDYPIAGDSVYAKVTEIVDKDLDKTQWESHRKYIDLQYVSRGKEKMGVVPVSQAAVTEPYNDKKDVAHYTADGTYYLAAPGSFFLFFPTDAHRPNIKVDDNKVRKIVIKIRAAE